MKGFQYTLGALSVCIFTGLQLLPGYSLFEPYPAKTVFSQSSFSRTNDVLSSSGMEIEIRSTGRPSGRIAEATIRFSGTGPETVEIPAAVITGEGRYQRYATPRPTRVTTTEPVTTVGLYGYCLDHDKATSPQGTLWPPMEEWDVQDPVVDVIVTLEETVTVLQEEGMIQIPFDGSRELEREIIVQFTLWSHRSGPVFDLCDRVRHFTEHSGFFPTREQDEAEGEIPTMQPVESIVDAVILSGEKSELPGFKTPDLPGNIPQILPAPETSHPEIADQMTVISTGNPAGHIADIYITNPTDQTILVQIGDGPLYIPGDQDQGQMADPIPPVIIDPGEQVIVPVYGVCADIRVLPTPAGDGKNDVRHWIGLPVITADEQKAEAEVPGVERVIIPTRTCMPLDVVSDLLEDWSEKTPQATLAPCLEGKHRPVPLIPGTDKPLYGSFHPEKDTAIAVPLILNAYKEITATYENLVHAEELNTVLAGNPGQEKVTVTQWAMWTYTEALYGHSLQKAHWDSVGKMEIEQLSGQKIDDLPEAQQEQIETGLDGIWASFNTVTTRSKLLTTVASPGSRKPPSTTPIEPTPMTKPEESKTPSAATRELERRETIPGESYGKPPPESERKCEPRFRVESGPKMDGGLEPPVDSLLMFRDDFIPLLAVGEDFDELWWECNPERSCPETPSMDVRPLNGRVRFEWEIKQGKGSFVELGCLNPARKMKGKRVIFMPPYVPIDSVKITRIELRIIDDNPTQPTDQTVKRKILIKLRRDSLRPDQYQVKIESEAFRLPQPSQYTGLQRGTCQTQGPKWSRTTDLPKPSIIPPSVADHKKMVFKEWIRLHAADIRDPDDVELWCRTECPTTILKPAFEDNVAFEWTILKGGGRFVKGHKGRHVIYEAPEQPGEVLIKAEVKNPDFLQIPDVLPPPDTIRIEVFRPGVRMDTTRISWLPKDGIELQKRSYLVYEKNNQWEPALAHQCRIHFIEMLDVSEERGICLNWPPYEAADTCLDLYIKKAATLYEVYDSSMCQRWVRGSDRDRENKAYYLHARTREPERECTVTVISDDYGGYGFIRSLANGTKSTERPYKSVEWKAREKRHPEGRPKKRVYGDNRVTIPKDIDENRIADQGWQASPLAIRQKDPPNPRVDADTSINNNKDGDGISAYEEYRGFFIRGTHRRFDMRIKDLLIWDRNNIGRGSFTRVNTGIEVRLIRPTEMDTSTASLRVINRNRGTHELGFDQKGIRLYRSDNLAGGLLGVANNSVEAGADGLLTCDSVSINVRLVNNTPSAVLANIIAHELSHAVSVRHHGEGIINGTLRIGRTMSLNGAAFTNNTRGNLSYFIACKGGLTSGMENCWMRYDNFIFHCPVSADLLGLNCAGNGWNSPLMGRSINSANDNVVGTSMCTNTTGTGINAGNACGDNASVGNCFDQIRISCRRP